MKFPRRKRLNQADLLITRFRIVRRRPHGLFALVMLALLFIPQKSVRSEGQSLKDDVVGTWDLVSLYDEDDSGREVLTFGRHPRGRLMLDFEGSFSFQVVNDMYLSMSHCSSTNLIVTCASAGLATLAYFGRYVVDSKKVIHLWVDRGLASTVGASERAAEVTIFNGYMDFVSSFTISPTGSNSSHLVWKRVR
jgi:hypothetical protein